MDGGEPPFSALESVGEVCGSIFSSAGADTTSNEENKIKKYKVFLNILKYAPIRCPSYLERLATTTPKSTC